MRVFEFVLAGSCLLAVISSNAYASQEPPVIYDVTTIYRLKEPLPESNATQDFSSLYDFHHPGIMEVHARTNARGLPFLLTNGNVLGPNIGVEFPEWRPSAETSGYAANNFTLSLINQDLKTPIINSLEDQVYTYSYEITSSETRSKLRPCNARELNFNLTVTSGGSSGGSELLIYLISKQGALLVTNNIYWIRCVYDGDKCTLYECVSTQLENEDDVGYLMFNVQTQPPGVCSEIAIVTFPWHFTLGEKYFIRIEIIGNSLRVTMTSPRMATTRVFDWSGLQPSSSLAYFVIGTERFSALINVQSGLSQGLVLNEPTGSVVSPPLPPALDRICVSLVFYSSQAASIDLHLQHGTTTSATMRNIHKAGMSAEGWTHQIFDAEIPEYQSVETRVVITAARPAGTTLIIRRIAGCNMDDAEDVLELPEQAVSVSRGVDVAQRTNYRLSMNDHCLNGGQQVKWVDDVTEDFLLCVCPPGFTGGNCLEGCGANSYGSDCGGVCSGTERGCRGMVLCKPGMDCDCAPGFKGIYCDRNCDSGEYGSGCQQLCGYCASDTCDVYTGTCHQGCQPGYVQPYCKQVLSYPSSAPKVVVNNFFSVSVSGNLDALEGHGVPLYYQLQYRKKGSSLWYEEIPQPMPVLKGGSSGSTSELGNVTGLEQGTDYEMRVVLIDRILDSYQGELVPSVAFSTPCVVPRKVDYATEPPSQMYFKTSGVGATHFFVEWKLPSTNITWCHVIGYEVLIKIDWRWVTYSVNAGVNQEHITGLLPGTRYTVKVRAKTSRGPADFSDPLIVRTLDKVPDHVLHLAAVPVSGRSLKVSWDSPKHPAGTIRHYHVTYQCVRLGSCPEGNCADSKGQMDVSSTSHTIGGLLPFAVYNISVAGVSGSEGPASKVQAATPQSEPDVAPSTTSPATTSRTNTSLMVHWAPPEGCKGLNGYLTGYRYELTSVGQTTPLFVGNTPDNSASFDNLTPHAEYVVKVFIVTAAGWSASRSLEITARTRATTPEMVQDLVVYKRGRRLLGLRWSPPRRSYGSLQSFTVSHSTVGGAEKPISVSVKPTPCPAWPSSFCHTINHLKQDTDYTITVQARNSEVNEDGEEVTITASTRESAPGAPSFLRVPNKTSDSLTIKWGLPDLINGQLRSFIVNIEETDSHNSSDCCQYFPIREVMVTSETIDYDFKMSGLHPSSSYEVSVSAKTVALGPALTKTVHTRPPSPVLVRAPTLEGPAVVGGPLRVRLEAADDYHGDLVSGYLLLLKDNSGAQHPPLRDEWLAEHLKNVLNGGFSLAAEFPKGKLPEGGVIELYPDGLINEDGVFGRVGQTELKPDTEYQLVWVLVLEYCDTLNEGHVLSWPFTVE